MSMPQFAAIAAALLGLAGTVALSHRFKIRPRAVLTALAAGALFACLAGLLAYRAASLSFFAGGVALLCALGAGGAFAAMRLSRRRADVRMLPIVPETARLAAASVPAEELPKLPAPAPPPRPAREEGTGTVRKRNSRAKKAGTKAAAALPLLPPEEPAPEAEAGEDEALTPLERLAKGFKKEQERIARAQEKLLMEQEREEREALEKRREQERTAHAQESLEVNREREALETERKRREEARRLREEKAKKAAEDGEARRIRERLRAEREKAAEEARADKEWRQLTFELEERERGRKEAAAEEGKQPGERQKPARAARGKQAEEAEEYMDVARRFLALGMRAEALPWLDRAYRLDAGNQVRLAAGMAAVEALIDLGRKGDAQRKMTQMRGEVEIDAEARQKLEELAGRLVE